MTNEKGMSIKSIIVLTLSALIFSVLLLTISFYHTRSVELEALKRSASSYSQAISAFRSYYSQTIVKRLRGTEINITHNYHQFDHAVPIPATMTLELAQWINESDSHIKVNVVSDSPFPWREQRQLIDIEKKALSVLSHSKQKEFSEIYLNNGKETLFYATPMKMTSVCVSCHNSHPDTPKNDWEVDDTRGLQIIRIPTGDINIHYLKGFYYLIIFIVLSFVIAFFIIYKLVKKNTNIIEELKSNAHSLKNTLVELKFFKEALDQHAIVSIADIKGNITYANERFCNISGFKYQDLMGKNHRIVKSNLHPPEFYHHLWKTITSGKVWHGEIQNRARNGDVYWVYSTIVPFLDNKNKPFQYISIRTDITERKSIEQKLSLAKEVAEKANQAKSQFLANMSHEIRTPMNGIIGLTNLALETTDLNEQQTEYIDKAHSSAEHLLGIINDILDFSKIEAGKLELESINFSMKQVTDNVNNLLKLKAHESGISFNINTEDTIPLYIQGDPLRFGQIILNLSNNAIKFTKPGGSVNVNLSLKEQNNTDIVIQCSVTDTGIGMTQDEQEKLFKPFSQTDGSITREYGGTGLGLVISQKLTELMGGNIWLESEKNVGSTFYFTTKFNEVAEGTTLDDNSLLNEQVALAKNSLAKARILLVEDNKVNQLVAKKILLLNKMDVEIANDGKEAIDLIAKYSFDGVLMDCMMPVLDGYKATEEIRKNEQYTSLPIIAMTANAMKQDIEKAIASGMNDHIAKPINPETMLITMAKWINKS